MKTRKIFITVKTYPTLSKKYDELVCTAGISDKGEWFRIYPLPFRKLEAEDRYKKYQWVEAKLIRNTSDFRPESYKINHIDDIKLIGEPVGTQNRWQERKRIVLDQCHIFEDLDELIRKAKSEHLSLAVFKPRKIIDFIIQPTEREWSPEKLSVLQEKAKQYSLFQTEEEVKKDFMVVRKLPYKFFYKFEDCNGKPSQLMIEDWEIGALFWNCLKNSKGDEKTAINLVKAKYLKDLTTKDLHLFLGTSLVWHKRAPNPFMIIGLFYPPVQIQQDFGF